MTEVNLNAKSKFDLCSIPSKFHLLVYDRMTNMYTQSQ